MLMYHYLVQYIRTVSGTSIIGHDREGRGLIRDSNIVEYPVTYDVTLGQIDALISISSHCQQRITYECYGSKLYTADGHVVRWKTPANNTMHNFGIGTGLQGCPCSLNGSKSIINVWIPGYGCKYRMSQRKRVRTNMPIYKPYTNTKFTLLIP